MQKLPTPTLSSYSARRSARIVSVHGQRPPKPSLLCSIKRRHAAPRSFLVHTGPANAAAAAAGQAMAPSHARAHGACVLRRRLGGASRVPGAGIRRGRARRRRRRRRRRRQPGTEGPATNWRRGRLGRGWGAAVPTRPRLAVASPSGSGSVFHRGLAAAAASPSRRGWPEVLVEAVLPQARRSERAVVRKEQARVQRLLPRVAGGAGDAAAGPIGRRELGPGRGDRATNVPKGNGRERECLPAAARRRAVRAHRDPGGEGRHQQADDRLRQRTDR